MLPLLAAAVPAQDQDALRRMVETDAQRLLKHAAAAVRGEAALLLAALGNQRHHLAVLEVARESDPAASLRGLVALGLLGAPGAEHHLGTILEQSLTRARPDGVAAALGLGLLPESSAAPAVGRYLAHFQRSSYRRQQEVLAALLVGMSTRPQAARAPALRLLLDDAANRDPTLRGMLVELLGTAPGALDDELAQGLLQRGSEPERAAALAALLARPGEPDPVLREAIGRLQQQDSSPEVRALALAWLTRARHLPAVELAAQAIRSPHPAEAAQAVRTAQHLAGGSMRRALEQHILARQEQAVQAAQIDAFEPPWSEEFTDRCRTLAADRRAHPELRAAAGIALARSSDAGAAPLLRDLFQETAEPTRLRDLAARLLRMPGDPPELERLAPGGRLAELLRSPPRIAALLAAGHAGAAHFALAHLSAEGTADEARAGLLLAFRTAWRPLLAPAAAGRLSPALQPLFR